MKNKIFNMHISRSDIIAFPKLAKIDLQNTIDQIKSLNPVDMNFDNTILKYEMSTYKWDCILGLIGNYELCHSDEEIRNLSSKSSNEYSDVLNKIFFDKDLYICIMNYINGNYQDEKQFLDLEDIKLIDDILLGFKKSGFHLEKKLINNIININNKINLLASKADQNLVKKTPFILCTLEELDGLPENIIASLEKIPSKSTKQDSKYKVSIQYPEYGPFMKYVTNRDKRKELYKIFMNNGGKENVKILDQLVSLRKQKTKILGFETHAHYKLSDRLAKHPDNVTKVINSLLKDLQTKFRKDLKALSFEAKNYNIKNLENYDISFLINKILERNYKYNEQKVREYFVLEDQIIFMFNLCEKLFDIKIQKISESEKKKMNLWHKDVFVFEIQEKTKDKETKKYIYKRSSILIMDLFPREGKYFHACQHTITESHRISDSNYDHNIPVALLVCNFPIPNKKTPSLINIRELETLYHEFGHSLHTLLSKTKYSSHFGTSVALDFVELPSQIMELWLTDKKYLHSISKHYISSKKLDSKTIDSLLEINKQFKALMYTKQLVQGKFDMDIYMDKDDSIKDKVLYMQSLLKQYHISEEEDILFISRFSHIYRGYDAGYYSYIWAEIILHDVFAEFKKYGLLNRKIGLKYKKEILEKGSSRDEEFSVNQFLSRKWTSKAFKDSLK